LRHIGQDKIECNDNFCYLEDMIGAEAADEAVLTRVRCAWGKFNELVPNLTSRGVSAKLKGIIYRNCVQSMLVYGSEGKTCTNIMQIFTMKMTERLKNSSRYKVRY
jgi:hypothetical protein